MKKYTYKDVKASFPTNKASFEASFSRVFHIRPISFAIAVPLANYNVQPYTISVISIFIAVVSFICLCIPSEITRIIGVILVPVWNIFDCVDGNLARTTRKFSDFGSAIDAISGYFIHALLPIGLGVAAYNIKINYFDLEPAYFILMGCLGSSCDLLARIIHQKYVNEAMKIEQQKGAYIEKGDDPYSGKNKKASLRRAVTGEIELTGFPMFLLLFAPIFNLYHVLASYYGILNILGLIAITIVYVRKCKPRAAK